MCYLDHNIFFARYRLSVIRYWFRSTGLKTSRFINRPRSYSRNSGPGNENQFLVGETCFATSVSKSRTIRKTQSAFRTPGKQLYPTGRYTTTFGLTPRVDAKTTGRMIGRSFGARIQPWDTAWIPSELFVLSTAPIVFAVEYYENR